MTIEAGAAPKARFDGVTVDSMTPAIAEVIAHVIGQSVAMEYYESDVDRILERIHDLVGQVAKLGRFHGGLRNVSRFLGTALHLRNRVVFTLALLDPPSSTWDDESLDRLFRELRTVFSLDERYRSLDHKLSMIRDSLALIADLTQQRRSMYLEIGIFVLILLEVVLFWPR